MARDAEIRLRDRLSKLGGLDLLRGARLSGELERLQRQLDRIEAEPTDEEIWNKVDLARHEDRPYTLDYVERILDDWFELHGDRGRADDAAIVAGIGKLEDRTVALIGHQKGRDIKERTQRNFGMAYPEGYRKAMRVMELADRHSFPLVTLVDTPGAYPGIAAEQHGQGGAIARSQAVMARLERADGRRRDRRGRLGRRRRDRARRPGADAGERDLLGDLARGLRRDPLARRGREAQGRGCVQAGRGALPRARRDRRDRARAGGRRAREPRRGRAAARPRPSAMPWTSSPGCVHRSCGRRAGRSSARWACSPELSGFSTASTGFSPVPNTACNCGLNVLRPALPASTDPRSRRRRRCAPSARACSISVLPFVKPAQPV